MSLLIKGMEMPKEGYKVIYVHSNGSVYQPSNAENIWHKIASAVPVPELHGRIGDLDKLNEEMRLLIKENMFSRDDARDLLETIADAPTVIPASGTEVE